MFQLQVPGVEPPTGRSYEIQQQAECSSCRFQALNRRRGGGGGGGGGGGAADDAAAAATSGEADAAVNASF